MHKDEGRGRPPASIGACHDLEEVDALRQVAHRGLRHVAWQPQSHDSFERERASRLFTPSASSTISGRNAFSINKASKSAFYVINQYNYLRAKRIQHKLSGKNVYMHTG